MFFSNIRSVKWKFIGFFGTWDVQRRWLYFFLLGLKLFEVPGCLETLLFGLLNWNEKGFGFTGYWGGWLMDDLVFLVCLVIFEVGGWCEALDWRSVAQGNLQEFCQGLIGFISLTVLISNLTTLFTTFFFISHLGTTLDHHGNQVDSSVNLKSQPIKTDPSISLVLNGLHHFIIERYYYF